MYDQSIDIESGNINAEDFDIQSETFFGSIKLFNEYENKRRMNDNK